MILVDKKNTTDAATTRNPVAAMISAMIPGIFPLIVVLWFETKFLFLYHL